MRVITQLHTCFLFLILLRLLLWSSALDPLEPNSRGPDGKVVGTAPTTLLPEEAETLLQKIASVTLLPEQADPNKLTWQRFPEQPAASEVEP